ncbi:unnamed protein product [Rotaria magnacalcarata]|uniref:Neurobeachin beta-propeller domain-containing protein n=1 Tax=Rotaria magnacalcarata TaxID=392030 RepID=A0A816Q714_9BILA|nr:unnamed protein product [Rotaria magnacalcarata]
MYPLYPHCILRILCIPTVSGIDVIRFFPLGISTKPDLVVSGSLDGTCKIHTVEHGIYVRILCPAGDPIVNLQLSNERHILIQIEKDDAYLFLYSINGDLIRTKKLQNKVVDMLLSDQHIILAVNHVSLPQSTNKKESTISVVTRIVIQTYA